MKVKTNISVDPEILKKAQSKYSGRISAICEKALYKKLESSKKDLPEEVMIVKCIKCKREILEGFYCPESHRVWCNDCHKDLNISKICGNYFQETTYESKQGSYTSHEHHAWTEKVNKRPELLEEQNKPYEPKNDLIELAGDLR